MNSPESHFGELADLESGAARNHPTGRSLAPSVSDEASRSVDITPSARRLTNSLRDIGYDFPSAVADIIDNSVSASATRVDIEMRFAGLDSFVLIADDGVGMSEQVLNEALRFGTRRSYAGDDLGRYGLGLKTASLSQCRRLTVATRTAPARSRLRMRTLDLDHVERNDRWEVLAGPPGHQMPWAGEMLNYVRRGPGTVVVWDRLDRVLPGKNPNGGWGRRRLELLTSKLGDHLGMVFHRFIENKVSGRDPLVITINGEKVAAWDPFAEAEEHTLELPRRRVTIASDAAKGIVQFRPYVLPARAQFSSQHEFERLGGPRRWNRQQGLYIYRADRLIQSGGWSGMRASDEHTKLARAAVDFSTSLDDMFQINVAKMRVSLPPEVRTLLEPQVTTLCKTAEARYRRETAGGTNSVTSETASPHGRVDEALGDIGSSFMAAAMATGHAGAVIDIISYLRQNDPDVARALGWQESD